MLINKKSERDNKLINYIIYIQLALISLFGSSFSDKSFYNVPGKINDWILLILLVLVFLKSQKMFKVYIKKKIVIKIYFTIFILYFLFTSNSNLINETGQDFLIIIYPIFIFLISKNANLIHLRINKNLRIFSNLLLIIYIFDFIFERLIILNSFYNLENIYWFDFLNLNSLESGCVIFLILFLLDENQYTRNYDYFLPFLFLFLISSQNRTILTISCMLVIYYLFLYFNNKIFIKIVFIFLGICFGIFISNLNFLNFNLISSTELEIKENTIRSTQLNCYFSNFFGDKKKSNCEFEVIQDDYLINYFIRTSSINEEKFLLGVKKEFADSNNFKKYQAQYIKILELGGINTLKSNLMFCIEFTDQRIKNLDKCDQYVLGEIIKYLRFKKVFIDNNICTSNLQWRLSLWKYNLDYLSNNKLNFFIGTGVGIEIPRLVVTNDITEYVCYEESINSTYPLRNSHNSFLTLLTRFGIFNFLIIFWLLYSYFLKSKNLRIIFLFFIFQIITFFEPVLDSPNISIPFWFVMFSKYNQNLERF